MENACAKECCRDNNCGAYIFQPLSHNTGIPAGSCNISEPCCWLVSTADASDEPTPMPHAIIGYPKAYIPPPMPPTPYEDLLQRFAQVLSNHLKNLTREVIPSSGTKENLAPCCVSDNKADTLADASQTICTCGYPGRLTGTASASWLMTKL